MYPFKLGQGRSQPLEGGGRHVDSRSGDLINAGINLDGSNKVNEQGKHKVEIIH